jgi:flagellar motor switch protein FliN
VSQKLELEQLHDGTGEVPLGGSQSDLRRLGEVPVDLTVEMGRTRMTVGETLDLRPGSIITLDRMAGEPVDLLVNGMPIARGEVVVIDEQFGLRITDVLGDPPPHDSGEQPVETAAVTAAETVAEGEPAS